VNNPNRPNNFKTWLNDVGILYLVVLVLVVSVFVVASMDSTWISMSDSVSIDVDIASRDPYLSANSANP
tara:strand:- start:181 stop:387 length:207 start_codon:yes stop_codon:yes gene_type:complete